MVVALWILLAVYLLINLVLALGTLLAPADSAGQKIWRFVGALLTGLIVLVVLAVSFKGPEGPNNV